MNKLIPEGWSLKPIEEFHFDISDGNYSSKYPKQSEFVSSGIPFIRANNLSHNTVIGDDMRFISPELHEELKKGHLKAGDILISTRGDIGQVAKVPKQFIDANINAQLVRINTEDKLNSDYLLQFLLFDETKEAIKELETGTALKQLPVGKLKQLDIVYPPLPEQQKIAAILASVDGVIEKTEVQINKLQDLKKGMMQELLTKGIGHTEFKDSPVGRIPKGWEYGKLSEFCSINPPLAERKALEGKTEVSFLKMEDVSNSARIMNRRLRTYAEVSKGFTTFKDKDVLLAKITPCLENGKGALVGGLTNGIGFGSTEFHVLRAGKNIRPDYLFQLSTFDTFRKEAETNMIGSAGQRRVQSNFLRSYLTAFPPISEQQKIAAILTSVDEKIEKTEARIDKLQGLKKSLMQDLLTGKVRVKLDS